MSKTAVAAVLLLATVGLVGCAGAPATESEPAAENASADEGRITAPTSDEAEPGEAALLEKVRSFRAIPILDSASDEQVVAAAKEACAQLESGTRLVDVSVIDGDDPAQEGVLLAKTAHEHLCPEAPMDMSVTP